ncbi:unnamed protein product [Allacma fusca]|uniref:Uncharacterized protein n=1 Tax=Allacma fusca TaxID=39272 RepID=A0A8J2JNH8_9HEXA|nr:unnamed protein product [Allacma fusca]
MDSKLWVGRTRWKGSFSKLPRQDCYEAKLRVSQADTADSRHYYLKIENSRGYDRYSVILQVRDPVSMATVIGVIIGCLILLVIVVLVILYAFKAEKWCFSQRGDFKPTDLESEKSDMDGSMRDGQHNGKSGFATIPQTEMQFGHHQTRKTRPPDPILPPDFHIMKHQQRSERSFRGRAYPAIDHTRKDINYADLQLPKTSNNGSMKKSNKPSQQHHPHHQQTTTTPTPRPAPTIRTDYAEIQFKPKSNEQAEV